MTFVDALKAQGLVLTPAGGRPPKTARDVAVYAALMCFKAGAPKGRPKLREAVVDLWRAKGYPGVKEVQHVTARVPKALAALKDLGGGVTALTFKGEGTTRTSVGAKAGLVFVGESAVAAEGESWRLGGPVWVWTYGSETAEQFDAVGVFEYRAKE